jgi:predicted secreted Zn-dependent protease
VDAPSPAADEMPGAALGRVSSSAGVDVQIQTIYYPVEGANVGAWRASMSVSSRRAGLQPPVVGQTSWQVRLKYAGTRATATGCEIVAPEVALEILYMMPRLASDSAASADDRAEWRRYLTALWTHERGHALRGAMAASAVREALRRLRASSCALVASAAQREYDAVITKYRASDTEYDASSEHGWRQGTVLVDRRRGPAIDTTYHDVVPNAP